MNEELKSCPFCGAAPKEYVLVEDHVWGISCSGDHLRWSASATSWTSAQDAREAWNTRAETSPTHSDKGEVCQCGHAMEAHIYHEGACRPGFVCETGCQKYQPVSQPSDKLEDEHIPTSIEVKWEEFAIRNSYPTNQQSAIEFSRECCADLQAQFHAHIDRLNAALAQLRSEK